MEYKPKYTEDDDLVDYEGDTVKRIIFTEGYFFYRSTEHAWSAPEYRVKKSSDPRGFCPSELKCPCGDYSIVDFLDSEWHRCRCGRYELGRFYDIPRSQIISKKTNVENETNCICGNCGAPALNLAISVECSCGKGWCNDY